MALRERAQSLRQLSTLLELGSVGGLTDRQLLGLFVEQRDEAAELAFGAIVDRHGPMVLRVCRAVLRDSDDAHDAFQATFLVLVKKARGLWVGESLGPWLHQVAYRTACCARGARARRRRHERVVMTAASEVGVENAPDDLGAVLHHEIERLPERYRAAVVHCLIEGQTPEQAALCLGWPAGTVRSRLARGRERLRSRLTRRGVVPSVLIGVDAVVREVVPGLVARGTVAAGVGLVAGRAGVGTVSSAVALMEGVLAMMIWSRVKVVSSVVLAGAVVCGTGVVGYRAMGWSQVGEAGGAAKVATKEFVRGDPSGTKSRDLAAIGKARLEVAKELRDRAYGLWQRGMVATDYYRKAQKRYNEIVLEQVPRTDADLARCLEAIVEEFKRDEDSLRKEVERGQAQSTELQTMELDRLDAEYALAVLKGKMGRKAD